MANAPQNSVIQALLTDMYQVTMAYSYWKNNKMNDRATFDLFFRKNPFQGEYTIFAGLGECLQFLSRFSFTESDIAYLRNALPSYVEEEFFIYLSTLTCNDVNVWAIQEGQVVFPRVPLLIVEGPLPVVQLLETTLLNLVNYASLVATNAARIRWAAGSKRQLLEFGLRRAQGPDGALSASRYCYVGGFDGTSNLLAGKLYGIPVKGTHAHAYVTSFNELSELKDRSLKHNESGDEVDFVEVCCSKLSLVCDALGVLASETKQGELAAFVSYARAFPNSFLALIDTYDVLRSGLPNFLAVGLGLHQLGYRPVGVRIDSGDLAYLSCLVRDRMCIIAKTTELPWFERLTIVASNDINEDTIHSLNQQTHEIDCFGIGTHLVTCQKQPALGCVFKLVELNGEPRIKLSQDVTKVTIPGRKRAYRLYGADGTALVDLLVKNDEAPPSTGQRYLCRNPFQESSRAFVKPSHVESLHSLVWTKGQPTQAFESLQELRETAKTNMEKVRVDHKRPLNPTPYKVSVSDGLYDFMHKLWLQSAPIGELC